MSENEIKGRCIYRGQAVVSKKRPDIYPKKVVAVLLASIFLLPASKIER